jgi:hypothetical protein
VEALNEGIEEEKRLFEVERVKLQVLLERQEVKLHNRSGLHTDTLMVGIFARTEDEHRKRFFAGGTRSCQCCETTQEKP